MDLGKAGNRVPFIYSMRMKIILSTVLSSLACIAVVLVAVVPLASDKLEISTRYSMKSLAGAYGAATESKIEDVHDKGMEPTYEDYFSVLKNAGMEGIASSYSYLVSEEGVMLYHPTEDKVGQMVENEVVKNLTAQLRSGIVPQPDVVEYEFKGVTKYAAYFILDNHSILVVTADEDEVLSSIRDMMLRAALGSVAAMAVIIVVILFVSGVMMKPLVMITGLVDEMSELKFISHKETSKLVKAKDEVGVMAKAVQKMRNSLRGVIKDVSDVSDRLEQTIEVLTQISKEIDASCTDNSATTEELAAGMQETTATTETINTSIGQMRSESSEIHGMTQNGEALSAEIESRAADLKATTAEAVKKAQEMFHTVKENTAKAIEESKAVDKINELTGVIMEISTQTSLLALNASIEAARAGEAGRGFAVVATEIGNLAGQTSQTVDNINAIVANVNTAVRNMSDSLSETTDFMEKNVLPDYQSFNEVSARYASDAAAVKDSMTTIQSSVQKLNETITLIAEGIEGINKTINESAVGVTDIAEKTTSVVSQTAENNELVANCLKDSELLKEIAGRFYIES